jgi:hypothetical protein
LMLRDIAIIARHWVNTRVDTNERTPKAFYSKAQGRSELARSAPWEQGIGDLVTPKELCMRHDRMCNAFGVTVVYFAMFPGWRGCAADPGLWCGTASRYSHKASL